ncbi:glutamate receptor 1.2 [Gossypium raimondii]|uniref:glutamate receptor 1.2 n=1 Tax=Gossypium raimondii TaxID=29730 RepID=UPI00063ABD35|nr:glutamate receptor 1.2 [Gossypium raimondii]
MIKNQILLLFAFYFSLLGELSGQVGGLGPAVDGEEVGVGLIVDMGSREGKVIHGRVSMAISDFNSFGRDNQMRIVLHTRDSKGDPLLALSSAFNLGENNKVKVILSAQKSTLSLAEFGNNTKIPVIPISAPYLIQVPLHDHAEVKGIIAFAELHKWEKVILIYEDHNDNHWSDFFEEKKFQVAYKSSVAASSKDEHIIEELHRLKAMETSVFVVHVEPVLASRIFVHAKRLGMASQGYAWIVTSKCMNHLQNLKDYSSIYENMQGFIGFRSYRMKESKEFDMLRLMNFITQMVNFEIVNVLGTEGERRVGFWTGKFTNKLSHGFAHGRHLFSSSGFETIIWPGGTSTIPKGRRMQTSTKTLRIAVPKSNGFPQLLKVDIDLQANISFSGFCIEVFKAAMAGLEHKVPYEFVPFEYNNPTIGEAYSDLVYQVYLQKYDGAVGDITITSNRSLYVDFTLPFTDMGIGMVSRLTPKENQNLWIFLKPLTPGLWLTIVGVYVLSALFIWLIERPASVERQTRQSNGEIGRMFGFSFSIFVFAHWEKLSSNLSRSVVVLWVFVVFILGSNYTATLTSMMTVQQIEFNSGKSIIGATGPVSQEAIGNLNFPNLQSKSIRLTSLEEYAKALSEGGKNG